MPALYKSLMILKHNLHKCFIICPHDWCGKVYSSASGVIRNASNTKYTTNIEIICKLKGCVSWAWDEGDTIYRVSLFTVHQTSWTNQLDCSGNIDFTIVVGALRIWSWTTCSEISPENSKKFYAVQLKGQRSSQPFFQSSAYASYLPVAGE